MDDVLRNARARAVRALRGDEDGAQAVVVSLWKALRRGSVDVERYVAVAIKKQKAEMLRGKYRNALSVELDEATLPCTDDAVDVPHRDLSRFDDEQKAIIEYLEEGCSVREIAVITGRSYRTVYRKIEKMLPPTCHKLAA